MMLAEFNNQGVEALAQGSLWRAVETLCQAVCLARQQMDELARANRKNVLVERARGQGGPTLSWEMVQRMLFGSRLYEGSCCPTEAESSRLLYGQGILLSKRPVGEPSESSMADLQLQSAIIVFNLAVTFQVLCIRCHQSHQSNIFADKSFRLYDYAHQLLEESMSDVPTEWGSISTRKSKQRTQASTTGSLVAVCLWDFVRMAILNNRNHLPWVAASQGALVRHCSLVQTRAYWNSSTCPIVQDLERMMQKCVLNAKLSACISMVAAAAA